MLISHRNILFHECFLVQICRGLCVSVVAYHALAACCFVLLPIASQGLLPWLVAKKCLSVAIQNHSYDLTN
jgi:hypothetical protein